MSVYRCCFLRDDGSRGRVAVLECVDDAEARKAALRLYQFRPSVPIELWQRERLVFAHSNGGALGTIPA
jgi:hypothetical protein